MAHNNYIFCAIYSKDVTAVPLECPCRPKCAQRGCLFSEDCKVKGVTSLQAPPPHSLRQVLTVY